MTRTVLILDDPNLNLLGIHKPQVYDRRTLGGIAVRRATFAETCGLAMDFRQANQEGQLFDWIHQARGRVAGIVINLVAWTHTSVTLCDALAAVGLPMVEVYLSNIYQREAFCHHSYVSSMALGVICEFGGFSYRLALEHFTERFEAVARAHRDRFSPA